MAVVVMRGELLTPGTVANELGTTESWVYKLLRSGDLAYIATDFAGKLIMRGTLETYKQGRDRKAQDRAAVGAAR